jgi:elongation factor Ts
MTTITLDLIKNLREKTGAGMMLCKEALIACEGDSEKSILWLRQKGIAISNGKIGRPTSEGLVGSYIHTGSRIGVLVEVLCETDFVAKTKDFKDLVHTLGMQIAACPNVLYVDIQDIPNCFIDTETELENSKPDIINKPSQIREKIVEGRLTKKFKDVTLMNQPYIRDNTLTISDLVKNFSAKVGENIVIKKFVRFVLGQS